MLRFCAEPALANRRPCSNCESESTSHPFLSLPAPLLPFPSLPLPFLLAPHPCRFPLKPAMDLEERCKLPQRGPGQSPGRSRFLLHCMLVNRIWLQHFWFFLGSKIAAP